MKCVVEPEIMNFLKAAEYTFTASVPEELYLLWLRLVVIAIWEGSKI